MVFGFVLLGFWGSYLPSFLVYCLHFAKKIAEATATLFFVALVTFLMGHAIPGGPFDGEKYQPPEIKKLQEAKYGLDKPLWKQFSTYSGGIIFHGDFGVSMKYLNRPVGDILSETLPLSLSIGGLALLSAILIGLPLGMLSALKPGTWWDTTSLFIAVGGVALPTFLIGAVLVLIFCKTLGWLPPARLDTWAAYLLPVLTLAARPASIVARLVRSSLIEQYQNDYVRTARAKGLSESRIVIVHALRNSLLPLVTIMGPISANILTGSFITEHFFAISGMAKHFIDAVNDRDTFLMMGATLIFAALLVAINLLVDLIYPILDPRMKA